VAIATRQTTCRRCAADLQPGAAYCDRCGERTDLARRNVRLAIRIEVLFLAVMILVVFGFTFIFVKQ
jgi:predicted nucleic acid-binding Zn ribbon protein